MGVPSRGVRAAMWCASAPARGSASRLPWAGRRGWTRRCGGSVAAERRVDRAAIGVGAAGPRARGTPAHLPRANQLGARDAPPPSGRRSVGWRCRGRAGARCRDGRGSGPPAAPRAAMASASVGPLWPGAAGNHPRRLVHHHQVLVLEDHLERHGAPPPPHPPPGPQSRSRPARALHDLGRVRPSTSTAPCSRSRWAAARDPTRRSAASTVSSRLGVLFSRSQLDPHPGCPPPGTAAPPPPRRSTRRPG